MDWIEGQKAWDQGDKENVKLQVSQFLEKLA